MKTMTKKEEQLPDHLRKQLASLPSEAAERLQQLAQEGAKYSVEQLIATTNTSITKLGKK